MISNLILGDGVLTAGWSFKFASRRGSRCERSSNTQPHN